jgi:hypothetical protein
VRDQGSPVVQYLPFDLGRQHPQVCSQPVK